MARSDADIRSNATPQRASNSTVPWLTIAAVPLAAAAAWIVYSALFIDHDRDLPAALPGRQTKIATPLGDVHVYSSGNARGRPLLLIHSINAAASSYEVRPLYCAYQNERPVYAIDLPGYGLSNRPDRIYTPREMVDAIHAVTAVLRKDHEDQTVDAIALSVSCEFLARAALERPEDFNSLGLISPTGFDKSLSGEGRAQTTKGSHLKHAVVSVPLWSQALYDFFVTRSSMRFFLEKTWGSKNVDQGLFEYDQLTAHRPGAKHVVWSFLSGFLFADDVSRLYRLLELPVWAAYGSRGDFVDYRYKDEVRDRSNWTFQQFNSGAFPHFELIDDVRRSYDAFLTRITSPGLSADDRIEV